MCAICWKTRRLPCSRCGTETYVALRWPSGPVCADCVDQALAQPQLCSRCGNSRPDVALPGSPACCPECADLWFGYQCRTCGQFTRPLRRGQCARCQIVAEITVALPGGVPEALSEFLDEKLWNDPERGIRWLRNSATARLLFPLLVKPEITHETLDSAAGTASKRAVARLRWTLITTGILTDRSPGLEHYYQRVAELLEPVPTGDLIAVRRYARWAVTRPLHERVLNGEAPTADLLQWPLARIRTAAQFTVSRSRTSRAIPRNGNAVSPGSVDSRASQHRAHIARLRCLGSLPRLHGTRP
jgi:hypothetical protein